MCNIKVVVVPAWLDLIKKELGITNDDLADMGKLSGILSPRDLLIYKVLNFRVCDVLASFFDNKYEVAANCIAGVFRPAVPALTLEENAATAGQENNTLIYGATYTRDKDQPLFADVCMSDSEVLCIRLVPFSRASEELKNDNRSLAEKITSVLFARGGLEIIATMPIFKRYVEEVPNNPVFY